MTLRSVVLLVCIVVTGHASLLCAVLPDPSLENQPALLEESSDLNEINLKGYFDALDHSTCQLIHTHANDWRCVAPMFEAMLHRSSVNQLLYCFRKLRR